ncbi:hypothetical protein F5Y03DRAFT_190926 [Xylaria venustula]|nr:hypothetical protein F5Y03DRAFT_190926 [Xylaria venustula]
MKDDDQGYQYSCNMYGDVEGFPPRPQSPKPVKSGAFSYDHRNGLRVGEISRASLQDLTLLFRKNAPRARRAAATKPWITAQLRLYDIAFDKSAKVVELRSTLEAAVKGGRCVEGGSPSVALVRERLATQFAQRREEYARAVQKHKFEVEKWHKENFSKLGDPSAEARYDLDFFFSKYFVDDNGLLAPEKTPKPVIIWDIHNESESLRRRVDAVPGLKARVTGSLSVIAWAPGLEKGIDAAFTMIDSPDVKADHPSLEASFDPDRFLAKYFLDSLHGERAYNKQKRPLTLTFRVAAFDRVTFEKLLEATKRIPELLMQETRKPVPKNSWNNSEACIIVGWAKQVIPQVESWEIEIAKIKRLDAKREERIKEKAILAELKPHINYARARRPYPSGPFALNHLTGSYLIHCRRIQDDYGGELSLMTLDIHAPTSAHGTVAAFNIGVVEGTMLLASSEQSLQLLRDEQLAQSDDEEELSEPDYSSTLGKRKAKAHGNDNARTFKRRLGSDNSQSPGRFYLQWAGCETGTAELVMDEDHERTGYLDLDKTGMTARGQFHYRALFGDKPLVFTLLKVADQPRKTPDTWSSYCEEVRWQRW